MFFPARGSVPANLSAVLFWPAVSSDDADGGGTPEVRFVRLDAAGPQEVPFTLDPSDVASPFGMQGMGSRAQGYRIVAREPLQEGARYALWSHQCSNAIATEAPRNPEFDTYDYSAMLRSSFAVFDVSAAAPMPAGLGAVTLSSPAHELVTYGGGSTCSFDVDAMTMTAEVAANPWLDAIAFSTWVDGGDYRPRDQLNYAPAFGDSWVGHGRDRVAMLCGQSSPGGVGVAPGKHSLVFVGRIPGNDAMLMSDAAEFELPACASNAAAGAPSVTARRVAARNPSTGGCSVDSATISSGVFDCGYMLAACALWHRRRRAR
jgi:hypothetical protein